MLKASIIFFCLGLLSIFLGATQVAGLSIEIGRMLLGVFLILTAVSFVVSMVSGKKTHLASILGIALLLGFSVSVSRADETVGSKVTEAANDSKRAVKKSYRKVKDETCSMVKGKMECAADKVKHSIQNGTDTIEDAVE
jgi:uncharacterized membrane protein YtjA (UPF0391 family)